MKVFALLLDQTGDDAANGLDLINFVLASCNTQQIARYLRKPVTRETLAERMLKKKRHAGANA